MPSSVELYGNWGSKDRAQILQELTSASIVGVDTETVSLEDKSMIGLAIAPSPDYAVWFSEDSPYFHIALNILRNPAVTKVFHNCKFDFDVLEPLGIDETNYEDTEILAYTLNMPQKLYNLSAHLGKYAPFRFTELIYPKGGTMLDIYKADPNFTIQKCCVDASLTLWCWYQLKPQIIPCYYIDRDVVHILRHMEQMGVKLNQQSVNEFYTELEEQTTYMRQLIQTKGCDPNSNQQVGIALAQRGWRLPYTKSRKQLKVDEKTIQNIDDPLAQSVLLYREKAKLKSTYAEPLVGLDRVYTTYNNTRVVTGRLSSSDPFNMQNIPHYFRGVFLADTRFASLDAIQIELRVIAYLAQDKVMMAAFANGVDIHKETMDRMGITGNISDPVIARRLAKSLNFAVTYLAEEETIIESAKKEGIIITLPQATDFKARYFQTYTGIRDYVYSQREQITRYGYVTTLFGRVRKADAIRMANPHSREAVIRELFNMPVQGTAAEIIKKMMVKAASYDLRIQVHDELVYDGAYPPASLLSSGFAPFETPLELKVGASWGDMKKAPYV
jgi:DNA polymerase-1